MRLMPMIAALASIGLASCASTVSPDDSRTEPVKELASAKAMDAPGDLDEPCDRAKKLPTRALSAGETERVLGTTIVALDVCADRHRRSVAWRKRRDAGLADTNE